MLEDAKRLDMSLVVLFMDLNKFKRINDTYGHSLGDEVLRITASRLKTVMRKSDLISRQGGDEFLIGFMVNRDDYDLIEKIKTKIPEVISKLMQSDQLRFAVGVSIGSAIYPTNGDNVNSLIDIADHKMYINKRKNTNDDQDLIDNDIEEMSNVFKLR